MQTTRPRALPDGLSSEPSSLGLAEREHSMLIYGELLEGPLNRLLVEFVNVSFPFSTRTVADDSTRQVRGG